MATAYRVAASLGRRSCPTGTALPLARPILAPSRFSPRSQAHAPYSTSVPLPKTAEETGTTKEPVWMRYRRRQRARAARSTPSPNVKTTTTNSAHQRLQRIRRLYPNNDSQKSTPKISPERKPAQIRKPAHNIAVTFKQGIAMFEPSFLRDLCTCSRCVHASTKQRMFETAEIPIDISPAEIKETPESLTIKWSNDIPGFQDHSSTFNKSSLYNMTNLATWRTIKLVHWDKNKFHFKRRGMAYVDYMNSDEKFYDAMLQLKQYGLLFLKGVPEDAESVSKIATRIGPMKNTFYGMTWDVRNIPDPKNVAYTNTALGFHMDLLYMAQPPGLQFLHCLKNELPGGASLFSDSMYAAQTLEEESPEDLNILSSHQIAFGYENDNQHYRHARKTIELSTQKEFRRVRAVNYSPPFVSHNPYKPTVATTFRTDSYSRLTQALAKFKAILERPERIVRRKMKPGECVIFVNRRVVHGREAFGSADGQSGRDRWLRGAYVDDEVVDSKFKQLGITDWTTPECEHTTP